MAACLSIRRLRLLYFGFRGAVRGATKKLSCTREPAGLKNLLASAGTGQFIPARSEFQTLRSVSFNCMINFHDGGAA